MTQGNPVGWFELYVSDMARAVAFYEAVMDVKLSEIIDPTGTTKMMAFPSDEGSVSRYGAMGSLVSMEGANPGPGGTMVYFSSKDCSIEESRVADAGGQVIRPKFSIGEFGWVSICQDSEGNPFGLHSM